MKLKVETYTYCEFIHSIFNPMKELIKILQLVIPTEKYSLCLVNPEKVDVHEVYITYSGHAVEKTDYYVFEPVNLETEILYAESYAILEEYNALDLDSTFHYEVLYVADGVIYINANLIMYSNDCLRMYRFDKYRHNIFEVEYYAYAN